MYKLQSYLRIIRKWSGSFERKPKLLDIGCGFGRFLKIAEPFFETHGIDPSEFAIGQARRYARRSILTISSLESYRIETHFDVVTAFDVLEHMGNVSASLKRIYQLLCPGGTLVCVVPVYDGLFGTIGGWLDTDMTHLQKLSRWVWLSMFEKQFTVLEKQGILRYAFPGGVYLHVLFPWLFRWGQAILVVMKK